MIDKPLSEITEEDLQSLIDNEVSEGKKLDYKEILPGNSHDNKKEFLKDVSAFANTSGGLLIYGISEDSENGIPEELKGLDITNPDEEVSRLENIFRNGVEPKISPIEIRSIKLSDSGKFVILLKVPKSWRSPHRITLAGHNKFYLRISNTNHEMDVSELRMAFNLSETLIERVRRFREDRISNIIADETPVFLNKGARIVLHLIPFNSFNPNQNYDLSEMELRREIIDNLPQIYGSSANFGYNFDGFIKYKHTKERSNSYIQLFRNGIIEAVRGSYSERKNIYQIFNEKKLVYSISKYLKALKNLGVEPPFFLFLTLISVKGYFMPYDSFYDEDEFEIIDRDLLLLPEGIIEDFKVEIGNVLKSSFDSVYNACGLEKSPNYNNNGRWEPRE